MDASAVEMDVVILLCQLSLNTERADTLREVGVVQAPDLAPVKQQVGDGQVDVRQSVILPPPGSAQAVGARPKLGDQRKQPPLQCRLPCRVLTPDFCLCTCGRQTISRPEQGRNRTLCS